VLAVFYLNNKEAKCELKINHSNETIPFCSEPTYLGGMLDCHVPPTPQVILHKVDITRCTVEAKGVRKGVGVKTPP